MRAVGFDQEALRAGNDLVGSSRQEELNPTIPIQTDGGRKIEVGKFDFLCPVTIGPIAGGLIKCRSDNGVTGDRELTTIAKNEDRGRQLGL